MRRLLNRLGIVGLITAIVIWGCVVLLLGSPFIGRSLGGLLYAALFAPPMVVLDCPLILSGDETETITATIANPASAERTYLVTMSQSCGGSCAPVRLCQQSITIEPGGNKAVACPIRLDDLRANSPELTKHIVIEGVLAGKFIESNPENTPFGICFIRSKSSFWIELAYGGGVLLTALIIIVWGTFLWPRNTGRKRTLIFLLSTVVYGLAWSMNTTVWLGLSNLHLYFLILGGMLLVMFMILWSVH